MMVELYLGDCLEFMKTMPPGSVDAVITDPPYMMNTKSREIFGEFARTNFNG